MSYIDLLHTVPEPLRKLFRKYEGVSKKLHNNQWSINFNVTCLKEDILPKFSRIRHQDPALPVTEATATYRKQLVQNELKSKEEQRRYLEQVRDQTLRLIEEFEFDVEQKNVVLESLETILLNSNNVCKSRILKKLNSLYQGQIVRSNNDYLYIKEDVSAFINLSNYKLTPDEIQFLNLGLNCHLQPKYDKVHKQVELEVLYQNLLQLEKRGTILVKPELADQLRSEGTKHRNTKFKSLLTPALKNAAKKLKNNSEIVIRKADKSSAYVVMNKNEYIDKINDILSDCTKFKQIKRNPIQNLKKKANKLIEALNAAQDDIKLPKIIGDFKPGYIYGNVKTHKPDNPLRPIISQIPTPTYNLAKAINKIISPYVPSEYSLKSSSDFIDLLSTNTNHGIIASLDVESLFTNVPIDPTIEIILQHVYSNSTLPPPKIPKQILKNFLEICTKEAPFRCPEGKMYLQVEGVAMGSPLGPTFANYYMGNLEKVTFKEPSNKPHLYARYMDDTFIQVHTEAEILNLRENFQRNSVLNFTYELSQNKKLPFLDVLVDNSGHKFKTSVYHKPTDQGICMNGDSECVEKYKISVISNYINRAFKISSTWSEFHTELNHMKQRLINNNYSNKMVDTQIDKFLKLKLTASESNKKERKTPLTVYYQSQTHPNYKTEERILSNIVHNNTKCTDSDKELKIIFYYKNKKNTNLVMKNNLMPPLQPLEQTNVIYKFTCPMSHGQATEYIGFSQTTLSQRLTAHKQNGSIYNHFKTEHKLKPTREQLTENTKIVARETDRHRLAIKEALLIVREKPIINKQFDNFSGILKLFSNSISKMENLELQFCDGTQPLPHPKSYAPSKHKVPPEPIVLPNLSPDLNLSSPSLNPCPDLYVNSNTSGTLDPPYSPRTMRLLTSPIKFHYNKSTVENEVSYTPLEIPDMYEVLKKFGIEPDEMVVSDNTLSQIHVCEPNAQPLELEPSVLPIVPAPVL